MSDYCRKCTNEHFGVDKSDFEGIISKEDFGDGTDKAAFGLCEGCEAKFFDHEGNRVRENEDSTKWERY